MHGARIVQERQADDAVRDGIEARNNERMLAVAGGLPQPRPDGWKGAWPPRRWQGHISHPVSILLQALRARVSSNL